MKLGLKYEVEQKPMHIKLDEDAYFDVLMYCHLYKRTYGNRRGFKPLSPKQMVAEIVEGFLGEDRDFQRYKKDNPDILNQIREGDLSGIDQDEPEDEPEVSVENAPQTQGEAQEGDEPVRVTDGEGNVMEFTKNDVSDVTEETDREGFAKRWGS